MYPPHASTDLVCMHTGEYYWDGAARNLYVYPPLDDSAEVQLSFRAGPGLADLQSAEWLTIRGVTITGAGGTAFTITGGENNTVGGTRISNCGGGVILSGGYRNRVVGNDIFDVGTHIQTSGNDKDGLQNLKPTNNLVSNNHITNPFRGGMDSPFMIRLRGLGDRLYVLPPPPPHASRLTPSSAAWGVLCVAGII